MPAMKQYVMMKMQKPVVRPAIPCILPSRYLVNTAMIHAAAEAVSILMLFFHGTSLATVVFNERDMTAMSIALHSRIHDVCIKVISVMEWKDRLTDIIFSPTISAAASI